MCGRFAAFSSASAIADQLALQVISDGARLLPPNWNVAPTQQIPVIIKPGLDLEPSLSRPSTPNAGISASGLELTTARWGLLAPWSHKQSVKQGGAGIINARAESVAEKRTFADAFANRRCLVPVNGYYEWQKVNAVGLSRKQPWYFTDPSGKLMLFAGIFNVFNGELTVAITTTVANEVMAPIHHRMPSVLAQSDMDIWFSADPISAEHLILNGGNQLIRKPVSTKVNRVGNNGPDLITEVVPLNLASQSNGATEATNIELPKLTLF